MNFSSDMQKKLAKWLIAVAAACILIYLAVQNIGTIASAFKWGFNLLSPLVFGVFIAMILNVPVHFFESHLFRKTKKEKLRKLARPLAMLLSVILILGIFTGIVGLIIPELVDAVKIIIDGAIEVITSISKAEMPAILEKIPIGEEIYHNLLSSIDWNTLISQLQSWLTQQSSNIMNTAVGTVSSVVTWFVNIIISLIFAVYVLSNKEKLKNQSARLVNAWIPEKAGSWIIHAFSVGMKIFRSFVSGQTLEAVIIGSLCMIGMLILKIPYAPMVGALVGVTAFIPVVGAVAGTAVGAFMILTVSPGKALIFVIYLLILQQIEGNLIYPKVMGDRVNLPAMWVLAAVTIGGGIAGPLGMLLGVPVTSTIYILLREETEKREKKLAAKKAEAESKAEEPEAEKTEE